MPKHLLCLYVSASVAPLLLCASYTIPLSGKPAMITPTFSFIPLFVLLGARAKKI
jgi:hypothetical protein